MAIRKVRKIGDPILAKRSKEVTKIDDKLIELINDMEETMNYEDGVGIAAVQVGILKRVIIVKPEDESSVYLNPEMLEQSGGVYLNEGCLSVPNRYEEVRRPDYVKVKYMDLEGEEHILEAYDFEARIFCHEIDHINGTLYVDRWEEQRKEKIENQIDEDNKKEEKDK